MIIASRQGGAKSVSFFISARIFGKNIKKNNAVKAQNPYIRFVSHLSKNLVAIAHIITDISIA